MADLTYAAKVANLDSVPKQAKALRKALVGKLPDWRPEPALFIAPAPLPPVAWVDDGDVPDVDMQEAADAE